MTVQRLANLGILLALICSACTGEGRDTKSGTSVTTIDTPSLTETFDSLNQGTWSLTRYGGAALPAVEFGELRMSGVADSGEGGSKAAFRPGGHIEIFETKVRVDELFGTVPSFAEMVYSFADGSRELEAVLRVNAAPVASPDSDTGADKAIPPFRFELSIRERDGMTIFEPTEVGVFHGLEDAIELRFDLDPVLEYFELTIDGEKHRRMIAEVQVPSDSNLGRISFEVSGNAQLSIEDLEGLDRTHDSVLNLANLRELHRSPYRVQYGFSMYNSIGAPLVLDQSDLDERVSIAITEDGQAIDLSESGSILHPAGDMLLDVVLVLDYSRSMADAFGGDGIQSMKDAAVELIGRLNPEHRVGVVTFNDTDDIEELVGLTTDHDAVEDDIQEHDAYNGFSPAWDAVRGGVQMLANGGGDLNTLRVLVFLSDGFDNSSIARPDDVVDLATDADVRVYNIGFGNLDPTGEGHMRRIASHTGGRFMDATIESLSTTFDGIFAELENNYQFSYVTGRHSGGPDTSGLPFNFELQLMLDGGPVGEGLEPVGSRLLEPIRDVIYPDQLEGITRRGLIEVGAQTESPTGTVRFILRANHMPRDIEKIGIRFETNSEEVESNDVNLKKISSGLLSSWNSVGGDADFGFHTSGDELSFGDFGSLFEITVDIADATSDFALTMYFDNSIYENGTLFWGGLENELIGLEWRKLISVELPDAGL
ncbi:MAG: hypothetical protein ACI841_001275 [Planctomycetota bacterium]|jgi:hypothetical protein